MQAANPDSLTGPTGVLFVDDEPRVLRGLQRALRFNPRWKAFTAASGEAGLELLAQHDITILVSDARMPGMDGMELLSAAKRDHPGVIRVVLSGFSDEVLSIGLNQVSHRYLRKPMSPEGLTQVLASLADLVTRVGSRDLMTLIDQSPAGFSFETLQRLSPDSDAPKQDLDKLMRIVDRNPDLRATVHKLANFSPLGDLGAFTSTKLAILAVGPELIRMTVALMDRSNGGSEGSGEFDRSLQHGLESAYFVDLLTGPGNAVLRAGALLHDCGEHLIRNLNIESVPSLSIVELDHGPAVRVAEGGSYRLLDHASLGALVLELGGAEPAVIDVVRYHHEVEEAPDSLVESVTSLHLVDGLLEGRISEPGALNWDHLDLMDLRGPAKSWSKWIPKYNAARQTNVGTDRA